MMLARILILAVALSALIGTASASEAGGICCEKDTQRAIRIGSKRYSCGFPSSTMSYAFNPSTSGPDLMTCACSKPQNCTMDKEEEQDFVFVSLVKKQTLPLSKLNDEVCDTGDDEPATSACAGNAFSAKYYFCSGGIPLLLPLSRVNDGIVDCCDCSDEPTITDCDLAECRRQREAMEREEREKREIISRGLLRLQEINKETSDRLAAMKREIKDQKSILETLVGAKQDAETHLKSEEALEQSERNERRTAAIKSLINTLDEALASSKVDDIVKLAAQVAIESGEALILALKAASLSERNALSDKLRSVAQDAKASQDEKIVLISDMLKTHAIDRRLLLEALLTHNEGANHQRIVELAKEIVGSQLSQETEDALTHDNQRLADRYQRPQVADARTRLNKAVSEETSYRNKIEQNQKTLALDLGVNNTLLHLVGKTFTTQSGEYTFKFLPFERCEQSTTNIGNFQSWSAAVSDEIPQEALEGKGVPKPTIVMSFDEGLRCYQGTVRSTKVYLRCGADDAILKVVEPEVCRYVYLFSTPVACVNEDEVLIATETFLASLWRRARSILPW